MTTAASPTSIENRRAGHDSSCTPRGHAAMPADARWAIGAGHGAIPAPAGDDPRANLARRGPTQILALQRHLHGAGSLTQLFSRASEAARVECGFSRAVVLSVQAGHLTADLCGVLSDPGSDKLRRQLLAAPVALEPGSIEAEFIRLAEGGRGEVVQGRSALRSGYGLEHFALGAVMPQDTVLALVVVDRSRRAVSSAERAILQGFSQLVTCAAERLIMRQRLSEYAGELRYMMTSGHALLSEGVEAPLALPTDAGGRPVFARAGADALRSSDDLRDLLTRREIAIAREMVAGRTNREIAETLHISPETVKKYVSRVMRKLGAANRAEAAVRCVRLTNALN
jgi:DNA-binding CsgD family transcriptional regulator